MTAKQSELLAFLKAQAAKTDVSPSFAEMMVAIGLASKSGIHRLLSALELQHRIERTPGARRQIKIINQPVDLSGVSADALLAELKRRGADRLAA